jgi:hypothetical protein
MSAAGFKPAMKADTLLLIRPATAGLVVDLGLESPAYYYSATHSKFNLF